MDKLPGEGGGGISALSPAPPIEAERKYCLIDYDITEQQLCFFNKCILVPKGS